MFEFRRKTPNHKELRMKNKVLGYRRVECVVVCWMMWSIRPNYKSKRSKTMRKRSSAAIKKKMYIRIIIEGYAKGLVVPGIKGVSA